MAMIMTGSFGKSLLPGVQAWFGDSYAEFPTEYTEIFKTMASGRNFEEHVGMYGLGLAAIRPEGSPTTYDTMAQTFVKRYTHDEYSLSFKISRNAIEDGLYMELAQARARALGFSMRQTKEVVGANVLNRAFNTSYTGADGLCMINSAHLLGKGGTFSNTLTTAADLSEIALEQALIDIAGFLNDAGLKANIQGRKLVIPKELTYEARRILGSDLQYDTANNSINAIKSLGMLPEGVAVNHYLTDSDAWFILTNCPDGLMLMERRALEIVQDTEFDTDNVAFKATERYCFGWTDPRGIYGSPGA